MTAVRALCAIDGSDSALRAARRAEELFGADSTIVLVAVVPPLLDPNEGTGGFGGPVISGEEAEQEHRAAVVAADAALAEAARAIGPEPIEQRVLVGSPADAICALAAELDADVVVVGASGRGAAGRTVFGSVSSAVIRSSPAPVLAVPMPHLDRG